MRKMTVGDMFCGAGGTSHGLVSSDFAEIAWAINHDKHCIEAHKKNHPSTAHFEEDIVSMNVSKLWPVDLLWASLECTHFSQAKGGQSRDADSRMLARQMYRYIGQTDPEIVVIENVKEFLTWGPVIKKLDTDGNVMYKKLKGEFVLDEDGNRIPIMVPDKTKYSIHYNDWVKTICAMGYKYEYNMLNSANYGAHTTRTRFFGVFVRTGLTICFPEATHAKSGKGGLQKWLPCRDYIDLENEGQSIFGRKVNENLPKNVRKPLADNTIKRIVAGIKKFCMDENDVLIDPNMILKYYRTGCGTSLNDPLHTITTKDRHVLVSLEKEHFVAEHFGTNRPIDLPMPTIMAYKDQKYMVTFDTAQFIQNYNYSQVNSLDDPMGTITTHDRMALATMKKMHFISKGYTQNSPTDARGSSINEPLHTITTMNRHRLITFDQYMINNKVALKKIHFISKGYSPNRPSNHMGSSLDDPLHTIMTTNVHQLVTMEQFIAHQYNAGKNPESQISPLSTPLNTITTQNHHSLVSLKKIHFVTQFYGRTNANVNIGEPFPTITTMNQNQLVTIEKMQFIQQYFNSGKNPGANIHGLDEPLWSQTTKVKEGLVTVDKSTTYLLDIKTRFLTAEELKQIQGFAEDYELIGSQAVQKKAIGNSVVPLMAQRIIEELFLQNHQDMQLELVN